MAHQLPHQRNGLLGLLPLVLVIYDVNCIEASSITVNLVLLYKVVSLHHAAVFKAYNSDSICLANSADIVQEAPVRRSFSVASYTCSTVLKDRCHIVKG